MKEENDEIRPEDTPEQNVGDTGAIAETLEEEITRLKAELAAKTGEAADNYDKYLRSCADFENYKKRAEREKADCIAFANENLLSEILPVVDNFVRSLDHANDDTTLASLKEGVGLIIEQTWGVLKKYGLVEVAALGEKFDPSLHHAISHEETTDSAPGTVVKEFQKGYILKGRLLRPSMVSVAKEPEA
ncbi:MAG: nucleotide exchange factor GrpE [Deltaproteobacteria bacterium RIFCSPLOWO2_02_FULL_53_8]|nr:MAG: nucleotide exchange factor GrpE [Deltaproteobacteria bacterium RIFCSPLOWO2_02_FULL_53_8]